MAALLHIVGLTLTVSTILQTGVDADYDEIAKSINDARETISKLDGIDDARREQLTTSLDRATTSVDLATKRQSRKDLGANVVSQMANSLNQIIPALKAGNEKLAIGAVINMAAGFGAMAFPGPMGEALTAVTSVFLTVVGLSKPKMSMTDMMEQLITRLLDEDRRKSLTQEVQGELSELEQSRELLYGMLKIEQSKWTDRDYDSMAAYTEALQGVKMLGTLEEYIKSSSKEAKKAEEAEEVIKMTSLYANVYSMRQMYVLQLMDVFRTAGNANATVEGLMAMSQKDRTDAENAFKFYEEPLAEQVYTAINLNGAKHPVVNKFLASLDIDPFRHQKELANKSCLLIQNVGWKDSYIVKDTQEVSNRKGMESEHIGWYLEANTEKATIDETGQFVFKDSGLGTVTGGLVKGQPKHTLVGLTTGGDAGNLVYIVPNKEQTDSHSHEFRLIKLPAKGKEEPKWYWICLARPDQPIGFQSQKFSAKLTGLDYADQALWHIHEC